jgi:hypothetical protein
MGPMSSSTCARIDLIVEKEAGDSEEDMIVAGLFASIHFFLALGLREEIHTP